MKLHGYFRSSAAYRVRIALNLKGLDYEYVPIDLRTEQHLGAEAHLDARVGQAEHLGRVADEGEIVELLQELVWGHAAPSLCGWCPSTADRALAWAAQLAPTSGMRALVIRLAGPDTDSAATTAAPPARTGAATAMRPGSSSSSVTA